MTTKGSAGDISVKGKTEDKKTIWQLNEPAAWRAEAVHKKQWNVLHDIKSLHRARTVTWNDANGKTGWNGFMQVLSNIKHNLYAWLNGKREPELLERLKNDVKDLEAQIGELEPGDITDKRQKRQKHDITAFYNELKTLIGKSLREMKIDLETLVADAEKKNGKKPDFSEKLNSCLSSNKPMTEEAKKELTEMFKQTFPNADVKAFGDALDAYATKKNSLEVASLADRLQVLMERCSDAFGKTAY